MSISVRIRWTPRLLGETWRRRELGEKTREIAASLGIEPVTLRAAWRRAGYDLRAKVKQHTLEEISERLKAGEKLADLVEEGDTYLNLYKRLKYHGLLPPLRTVWTDEMIEDVLQQKGLGVPMADIAAEYGVSPEAVRQELYRRRETEIRQEWTPELIEEARKLKNKGLTYEQVALELGVSSVHSVRLTLKRVGGVKRANRWSRRKLSHVQRRLQRGDTLKEIAKDYGIQRNSLRVMLQRKGLL